MFMMCSEVVGRARRARPTGFQLELSIRAAATTPGDRAFTRVRRDFVGLDNGGCAVPKRVALRHETAGDSTAGDFDGAEVHARLPYSLRSLPALKSGTGCGSSIFTMPPGSNCGATM